MKLSKVPFFLFFVFSHSIFSFNFCTDTKLSKNDYFWHLKISKITFQVGNEGSGVRIAILDTNFIENPKNKDFLGEKIFNMSPGFDSCKNLNFDATCSPSEESVGGESNHFSNLKFEARFFDHFLKKNHAACAVSLIQQIAPKASILSFPIFNDQATTNKYELLSKLKEALREKIDILYLGLKLKNFDPKNKIDIKILKLLKRFDYVVCAAGNDGLTCNDIAFPAKYLFFSVGAFKKENSEYFICDFSQFNKNFGPNFVMPGQDLFCYIWHEKMGKNILLKVSGTSMAAALMVGHLANILSCFRSDFNSKQIQYLIQKNSIKLHQNLWNGKVQFGVLDEKK